MASSSDLNLLLEMGFEEDRAKLAIKKAGARTSYPRHLLFLS